MNNRTGARRKFLKGIALFGLISAAQRVSHAHAKLIRSEPKSGVSLREPPKNVELWFDELLDDEFNTIQVFSAQGLTEKTRLTFTNEKARLDPKDRTHLIVGLKELVPGDYAVEYRVLSRDGHTAPGRFVFTVLPKPPG